ncbi:LysE family translocator [Undibacterium sp. CY18W]|uniref:LysE family translocator n=1 Tax=Undibacterium hunanense TaxID=2762292 RepID=A0ABR6ZXI1_9BURK|nr:LysE family translocator [Undibacterium hunanense]MBC3920570.1 LysE family translocator [Undibacterium hunanense]
MDITLFFKAALIGLSIAAPVGPIGLLCIQRTMVYGMRTGFVSGLGAACADATYGAIGAFGLAAVTDYFIALSLPLAIAGALFLAWMGGKLLWSKALPTQVATSEKLVAGKAFISIFLLTITNPMTIVSFVAVFASIAGSATVQLPAAGVMVLGVFLGSACWWLLLSCGIAVIRKKLSTGVMMAINRLGGCFLLGFAIWQLWQILPEGFAW